MAVTDTSESGLETIIVRSLLARGWLPAESKDYDRTYCLDLAHLRAFVLATQPKLDEALDLGNDSPTRRQFLARLEKEINTRGVIDVLRKGARHNQHELTLFYASPSPGNAKAAEQHALNRFSVTRQLRYSNDETRNALDVAIFINGFSAYYRTTVLSEETDPNKLHDLQTQLDAQQVYSREQVDEFASLYLSGADREKLDPILDTCVATYKAMRDQNGNVDEDAQVAFKGKAKSFTRTYDFLGSILPYTNPAWEKLSIFLNFLTPKLPAPEETDLSKGILESIDMDSYRVEKRTAMSVALPDEDATIGPIPVSGGGRKPEPEMDRLSNILQTFNEQFGTLFTDADRIIRRIHEDIAPKVAADVA